MQQKYALVTTALIHGTTNKRGGRWHHQKLNFVHVPFTNKRLEYNIKYFTQYHQTHLLLDIDTKVQNGFDIPWTKLWILNFITVGKYNQIIFTIIFSVSKAHSSFGGSELLSFYAFLLSFQASLLCSVFLIFLILFQKPSPYLSRKSGFVENFNVKNQILGTIKIIFHISYACVISILLIQR